MGVQQYSLVANDWLNLEAIINDLTQRVVGQELYPSSSPTFTDITLTGSFTIAGDVDITGDLDVGGTVTFDDLTASRLVATDGSKGLVSLASPLIVSEGGTGAATLIDGGILLGSGTGTITAMAVLADGEFVVGDGTTDPVAESGNTARTSLGVGTDDSPQLTGIELGHASDTTLTRVSAGVVAVEGTNIAMSGGAHHDGFSDFVSDEHIAHTGVTLTAGSGIAGGGDISANRSFDLDINSLSVATIVSADFIPFWDITAAATNKKITFTNFEAALTHDNLLSGTIADHDTGATGADLDTLTDNSIANALHRHSELVASDSAPDPALSVDAAGNVGIGTPSPGGKFQVVAGSNQYTGIFQSDQAETNWSNTYGALNLANADSTINNHNIVSFSDAVGGASSAGFGVQFTNRSTHYGSLYFYTNGTGGYNQRVYIQSNGNVGIGTTSPDTKLQVVGTAGFGDDIGNEVLFGSNGNQSFVGSAGFYPRVLNQSGEPAAGAGATQCDTGEAVVWTDTDDAKCYLCYNHGGTVKTIELV